MTEANHSATRRNVTLRLRLALTLSAAAVAILFALLRVPGIDDFDGPELLILLVVGIAYFGGAALRNKDVRVGPTVIYLMLVITALDALDKFEGYGNGEYWFPSWLLTVFALMVVVTWLSVSSRHPAWAISVALFFLPVSQLPVDLARNLMASRTGAPVADLFVTKFSGTEIYGVEVGSNTKVRWIRRQGDRFIVEVNDVTGLGSGTMGPQYVRSPEWYRRLVSNLLGRISLNRSVRPT